MRKTFKPHLCVKQQGFTLIEVLVAMLITSFGLLGIAGLVVSSLRYNQTAWQRSVATELALDMMDRMRANSFALIDVNGGKVNPGPYMKSTVGVGANPPTPNCTEPTTPCSPNQMAAWDWYEWRNNVVNQLPGGQGLVRWDTTAGTKRIQVIVTWKEAGKTDKTWDDSLDASVANSTNNANACPTSGGLTIDGTVRCFQATFYP